ncbi:MAG TPA: sialate O-acetylesterase [Phycisphaerae bacterium]|nr:sialate O-acetylesterase [Phycisphaerae bacterium]HOI55050.1 sialate O-acetylesterase [Phycisphaerae bacterium]
MDAWRIKVADVRITEGAEDFRIYQQDAAGRADITVGGTWDTEPGGTEHRVWVRLLRETDNVPLEPVGRLWADADTVSPDGTWRHTFRGVPAGGPYRIETHLIWTVAAGGLGGRRGDTVHFLGVGDLWIVAGQSNASGTGHGAADDGPELGVHLLGNGERWRLAAHPLNEPAGTDHPNRDNGAVTSPALRFAKTLRRELGYPIGLVQTARGGSSLVQWHVEEDPQAKLWHNMVHCVHMAGGRVRGMLWYQGCSDGTVPAHYTRYGERFARFVARARQEFGPFVLVSAQISRWTDVVQPPEIHLGWSQIREAQRHVSRLGDAVVVAAMNAPLSDGIHNSASGNVILGERLARAALGAFHGKAIPWQSPNVRDAVRSGDGRTITLNFDDVTSQLVFIGMGVNEFVVEDAAGRADVTEARCDGSRVELKLSRPLEDQARIHAAYGIDPAWTLCDYATNVPALAFYGLAVNGRP